MEGTDKENVLRKQSGLNNKQLPHHEGAYGIHDLYNCVNWLSGKVILHEEK
jgi:hypothetical protein